MKLNQVITKYAVAAVLLLSAGTLIAQPAGGAGGAGGANGGGGGRRGGGQGGQNGPGGGNFDPAQFQQQQMDRVRQSLEITDDTEWNALLPLVQKVVDARTAVGFGGRGGGGRGGRGGGGGGIAGQATNPERDALQKAVEDNAPAGQIKDLLTKYQEAQKAKQAKLTAAQEDLRKVLTKKQEAQATLQGLLQ